MSWASLTRGRIADKWWVLMAITLGMFMSLMDSTIVNVAVPQIQIAFGADIQDVQWVVTIYMITQAAVIPTAPYLAARFGEKRAYVGSLFAFFLGTLLCGFAWSLPALIFFRLIQGIGGGILLPLVSTLLYQTFSTKERGTASSVMGVFLMVAPLFGPLLGGYLVTSFGWPWAFFTNVPLGIGTVILAQKALQHTPAQQQVRFDSAGFLTAAAGSTALLYGISAVMRSPDMIMNLLFLSGGILLLLSFGVIELVKQEPLLDLRRFKDRTFTFSSLAHICVAFARFGTFFLIPIYLQILRQQTALQAGAILAAQALATLAILPIGGRLSDKLGPRPVVIAGLIVFAGAFALMITLGLTTPIWLIVAILMLLGVAFGLVHQIPVAAMSQIDKDEHQEVANGSTLLTVLHATAAPLGVTLLSSLVQRQSQQYTISLANQGITDELLQQQSTLLAMHESFLVASLLVMVALVAMFFVPKRTKPISEQPDQVSITEASTP